jgi:transcriptional regulator GlxA family with amidase domain
LKGDTGLVDIALSCGFSDQCHFSRAFRRKMGTSPARFRKSFLRRKSESILCLDSSRT